MSTPNVNNYPGNGAYTQAQLAAFINESPTNYISWACNRNPTAVYNWIVSNYAQIFPRQAGGWPASDLGIGTMYRFLVLQYGAVPAAQQAHWLAVLGSELPPTPELPNWTNPKS